jgi:hypothetical protein
VTVLIVVLWSLIGFGAGTVLLGELGPLFGFRAMEGQSAIFGLFVGGPVGILAGSLLGLKVARRIGVNLRRQRTVALGSAAILIGIPLSIWLVETWRHSDHLTTRPNTWDLGYQVRLPAGQPTPAGEKVGVELRSAKESPKCTIFDYPHGLSQEGNHFIISGNCPLFYATPERRILVRIGDKPTLVFDLRVKARPEAAVYSDWFPVDEIYDNATGQKRAPRADEGYAIRYGAR